MTQQKQTENQRPEFLTRPMRLRTIRHRWETHAPAVIPDKTLFSRPQNPYTDEPILDQMCLNPRYFTWDSGTSAHSLDSFYRLRNPWLIDPDSPNGSQTYYSQGQDGAMEWDLFIWLFTTEITEWDDLRKWRDAE